jgi:hypothetical protein
VAATLAVAPVPSSAGGIVESATETGGEEGLGSDPCDPPPQPEIVARMLMVRREKFLFQW